MQCPDLLHTEFASADKPLWESVCMMLSGTCSAIKGETKQGETTIISTILSATIFCVDKNDHMILTIFNRKIIFINPNKPLCSS